MNKPRWNLTSLNIETKKKCKEVFLRDKAVIWKHRNLNKFLCGLGSLGERICFPPRGDSSDVMSERQRGGAPMAVTPKGVIWDMDGVLANTAPFHYEAWKKILTPKGIDYSWEEFTSSFGMKNDRIIPQVLGEGLPHEEINRIDIEKEALFREFAKGRLKPIENVVGLLNLLKGNGFKMAVASSGSPENVESVIEQCRLTHFFSILLNGKMVHNSKPHPEIFLLASEKLAVPPEKCIVVEDAPAGVEGAKRASMKCIAITSTHSRDSLKSADIIVDSFKDLNTDSFNKLID